MPRDELATTVRACSEERFFNLSSKKTQASLGAAGHSARDSRLPGLQGVAAGDDGVGPCFRRIFSIALPFASSSMSLSR